MAERLYEIECEVTAVAKVRVRIHAESPRAAEDELEKLGIAQVDWAPGESENFLNIANYDHEVVAGARPVKTAGKKGS